MSDRLFFALWPDERSSRALEARLPTLLDGVRGKPQRPDQWHITLEFLGDVADVRQPAVWAAAGKVAVGAFEVVLDRLEHWRKPQVYCLSATRCPHGLARLVAELRASLAAEGFVPEAREYQPHLTLARKVRQAPSVSLPEPIAWPAGRFALVRSVTDPAGSRYEPLRWWNLHEPDG